MSHKAEKKENPQHPNSLLLCCFPHIFCLYQIIAASCNWDIAFSQDCNLLGSPEVQDFYISNVWTFRKSHLWVYATTRGITRLIFEKRSEALKSATQSRDNRYTAAWWCRTWFRCWRPKMVLLLCQKYDDNVWNIIFMYIYNAHYLQYTLKVTEGAFKTSLLLFSYSVFPLSQHLTEV